MQKIINDGLLDENSQQIAEQTVEDLEKMEKARLELGDDDLPADVGRLLSPQPDKKLPPISAGVKQLIQTNFKIAAGEAHKGEPTPTKEEQKAADSQLAAMLPDYIRKIDQYTGRDRTLVVTWKKTIDDQSESYPQAVAELKRVSDEFWSGLKPTPKPTPELKKGKFAGGAGDDYTYEFSKKAQDKTKETGELHATVVTKTDTDTGLTSKYGPATFKVPVKHPLHAEMMGDSNVKKFLPGPAEDELPEGWTEYVSEKYGTWYYPTAKGAEGNMQRERPTEGIAVAAKDLPQYTLEQVEENIRAYKEYVRNRERTTAPGKAEDISNIEKLQAGWEKYRDKYYPETGESLAGQSDESLHERANRDGQLILELWQKIAGTDVL